MENNNKRNVLMRKYEVGKFLGQGNFAKVYHARNLESGSSVAIKAIDKEKVLRAGLADQTETEISAMTKAKHPNVVEIHEVMATKTKIYIVMEYAKGGELFAEIARRKRLGEGSARKYFRQLVGAVDHCHSRGVFHRDLKPENLLLDGDGNLKVSDFGLSALAADDGDALLRTACGTPAYTAPEVVFRRSRSSGYDGAKADVWSCGVVLFVLLAGFLPFHDGNIMEMYRRIGRAEYTCPDWISPEPRRLISKMLNPDPDKRISTAKIMESSWLRKGQLVDDKPRQEDRHGTTTKPNNNLNAFDIISLSAGFDLSGLLSNNNGGGGKRLVGFASGSSAAAIAARLEEIGRRLGLSVAMRERGSSCVRMEGFKGGRKGWVAIEAEVFEFAPSFHLVEVNKSSGDALEYDRVLENDIRPALKDVVWAWHGE